MNVDGIVGIAASIVTVAAIWVIVTGPQTGAVIRAAGEAFAGSIRAAQGRG